MPGHVFLVCDLPLSKAYHKSAALARLFLIVICYLARPPLPRFLAARIHHEKYKKIFENTVDIPAVP